MLNLINDKDYDVIALTEIYPKNIVDSNVSDIEWKIKGYKDVFPRVILPLGEVVLYM